MQSELINLELHFWQIISNELNSLVSKILSDGLKVFQIMVTYQKEKFHIMLCLSGCRKRCNNVQNR
jgi:hypothetical protein